MFVPQVMAGCHKYGCWQNCFTRSYISVSAIILKFRCDTTYISRTEIYFVGSNTNSSSCQGIWMCCTQFNSIIKSQKRWTPDCSHSSWSVMQIFGVDGWKWKSRTVVLWAQSMAQVCESVAITLFCYGCSPLYCVVALSMVLKGQYEIKVSIVLKKTLK